MKSSESWSFCPYQGEGIRLAYFLGWRVFLESLQKSLQTTLWFPGCYKSVRFYKCTLRWLLSWAVSAQYVCAFTWFSLNSPSVSKLTSFKIVCMWQGCAFCLSSMQSSIQNVHDRSLPLPSVVFGLGSVLLCASMHLSEGFFFFLSFFKNGLKASVSAMMGRCLCSYPPPPPGLPVAGQLLVPPSAAGGCSYQTCGRAGSAPAPALPTKNSHQ